MIIQEQTKVEDFVKKYDLENDVITNVLDLVSEVGEVAKEVLLSNNYGKTNFEKSNFIQEEVGDALFSLLNLANSLDIDLEDQLVKTLEKYEMRINEKDHLGSS